MDDSPLRRLSPELRNRIYELALHVPGRSGIKVRLGKRGAQVKNAPLALTKVCREIRADTVKMFYAVNSFTVYTKMFDEMEEEEGTDGPMDAAGAAEMPIDRTWSWFAQFGEKNPRMAKRVIINLGTLDANEGNAGGWLTIAWGATTYLTSPSEDNPLFPTAGPAPAFSTITITFNIDPQPCHSGPKVPKPYVSYRFRRGSGEAATRRDLQRSLDLIMERVEMDEELTDEVCHWYDTVFVDWHKIIVRMVTEG
ncbi:hypothetical protein B0A54_17928 [Friedmanniomyces endolithicus]|uniref:Uncharacterized protein n=1 Tax=Friedmanniomyces endolithicus TaxID=329885 RepID=A0A4V5N4V8_9PEZI|nr:hypothetical protein LTS09_001877 [Friedmanniomyces endolithicus]TKA22809.1 hypothetical protein B0A54_17928 [Friedmanniomyces endolithicus]